MTDYRDTAVLEELLEQSAVYLADRYRFVIEAVAEDPSLLMDFREDQAELHAALTALVPLVGEVERLRGALDQAESSAAAWARLAAKSVTPNQLIAQGGGA